MTERRSGPVVTAGDHGREGSQDDVELTLGRRADYAIRATLDLAGHVGERRKAREIGDAMGVPTSYLPQILAALVRHGIASSVAGPRGGYGLARAPDQISVLDVVVAVDGDAIGGDCVLRGGPCHWDDRCAIHEPWLQARHALLEHLDSTTFAFLLAEDLRSRVHRSGILHHDRQSTAALTEHPRGP